MKSMLKYTGKYGHVFVFGLIAILALALCRIESSRQKTRSDYEKFLTGSALPFKNLKSEQASEKEEADSPELASLQEYLSTMDPAEKYVPSERLYDAYVQQKKILDSPLKISATMMQWTGTDADMGGRTRAIMWDPYSPKKVWAGGVTGGLWFNTDITSETSRWQPVNDMWDNLAISCITYDPNDPRTMYVGTGEAPTALITYRESGGRGVGIWKTIDGGDTWTLLPSTKGFAFVNKIIVKNVAGKSVIYAGLVSGYYHGIQQNTPSDGLFRSDDGGLIWEQVLPSIPGSQVPYGVSDVVLGGDGRIYVGTTYNVDGNGGAVVLYSDSGNPGSWIVYDEIASALPYMDYPLPGRVILTASPSDPNVVYAAFAAGIRPAKDKPVYYGMFIFKTSDKGATWDDFGIPNSDGSWANLAWHAMTLAVDPNNSSVVYAGGLDVWRTINNGASWEHLSDWAQMYYGGGTNYVHADQHTIMYKPGSSSTILFGCDGGVFMTLSGNAQKPEFIEKNKGYNTLQFYTGAMHPGAGEKKYLGGLQDNGTLYYKGTPLTIDDMVSGGDGATCFWDAETPEVYFTSVYYNRYYIFQNNINFNYIDQYSGIFINPADYNSPANTLYANGVDFWGGNANTILRVIGIPQSSSGYFMPLNTNSNTYFSHVKVSPYTDGGGTVLFLGSASGRLFKVKNANAIPTTTEIGDPAFPPGSISCVAVGGSNDTLLVTFSNYGVSSVWQTYNGGQSWREVEGNLPDMPIRWAIYHPQNSRQALIATELGVWSTGNLHAPDVTWTPETSGMANVRVDMLTLRQSDNTVLAATHGRGLYTTIYEKDLFTANQPQIAHNPFNVWTNTSGIQIESGGKQDFEYAVYSLGGKLIKKGTLKAGQTTCTIAGSQLAKGVYLLKLISGTEQYSRKIVY